ncbi:MAG: DUF1192 domain-containing protein [Inquilinaceae bacterium]
MEPSDLEPLTKKPPKKNLDVLSIGELNAYIEELEEEIARTRAVIAAKSDHRSSAESLFKR